MSASRIAIIAVIVIAIIIVDVVVYRKAAQIMRAAGIYLIPRTKFGPALIFSVEAPDGSDVRVLNIGKIYQSGTYLDERYTELAFEYTKLYDLAFATDVDVTRLLMIGGGGYSYPKYLIANHPEASIDVVEIDPKITSVAQRYFFLDRLAEEYETDQSGRLGLICADGRDYLGECVEAGKTYDAILNDSFCGKVPAESLTTVEAAKAVHACLTPGGAYLANVVSAVQGEGSRFLQATVATLRQVFAHVYVIPCAGDALDDRDNNMVLACDAELDIPGAIELEPGDGDPILTDANNPVKSLIK